MSEASEITVSAIGSVATIAAAGIAAVAAIRTSRRAKRIEHDTAETREHVANSHIDEHGVPINLRDEQDRRHGEVMAAVGDLAATVQRLDATQRGMQRDIGRLTERDERQERRADDLTRHLLENTQPRHLLENPDGQAP